MYIVTIKANETPRPGRVMPGERKKMNKYRTQTTENLIEAYAFEAMRINQQDREATQKLIKRELKRRFAATIKLLDDDETTENPLGTYNYLLGK